MDENRLDRADSDRNTILALLAIAAIAIVQRFFVPANADVAWLLTVAEKTLDGRVLYRDILETNPPFSVYLYLPPVVLGRLLSLRPEAILFFILVFASAASLWAFGRIAPKNIAPFNAKSGALLAAGFAALTLLPGVAFGEREHFALILFLPCLALALRRAAGLAARTGYILIAGVCAGLVFCIKPHFAMALVLTCVASAYAQESWRPFFAPENFIAAGVGAAFTASIFIFNPAFWSEIMPLVWLLYIPVRVPLAQMLDGAFALFVLEMMALCGWIFLRQRQHVGVAALVTGAAISGFLLAALAQGKGWPYHFYPAFALIVVFVASFALKSAARVIEPVCLALALAAQFWLWFGAGLDMSGLDAKLRAVKERPRMLSIVSDFAAGFPNVRAVDGIWVGRAFSRWVSFHAMGLAGETDEHSPLLPAYRAALAADKAELARDIVTGKPDIILIERLPFDFLDWARRDAALAALLTCYEPRARHAVGTPGAPGGNGLDVEIWGLRAPVPLVEGCPL